LLARGVLLDLDDTILDDSGGADACWEEACTECVPVDGHKVLDEITRVRDWYWADPERHREGRLDMDTARRYIVATAFGRLSLTDHLAADRIAARYSELRDARITELPGAVETVCWLRDSGCRLALVTNGSSSAQRAKIRRFQLEPLFDAILVEGECGFGKPDERIYLRALQQLDVPASDAYMVGDKLEWDVLPAKQLGLRAAWIDVKGAGLPSGMTVPPDRIVRSLRDLRTLA
jgi:putative hydrolase of the HAD superfamily